MYSERTLYYLDQLGIQPWIKRETSAQLHKILLLEPDLEDDREKVLYKNILFFIKQILKDDELIIIKNIKDFPQKESLHDSNQKIIVFGEKLSKKNHLSCKLCDLNPLKSLLSNFQNKKTVFQKLSSL